MTYFTIPNAVVGSSLELSLQGEPDTVDFTGLAQGIAGNGILSGGIVTPQTIPTNAVNVAALSAFIGNYVYTNAAASVSFAANGAAYPRFDLVVYNSAAASVAAATEAVARCCELAA